MIKEGKTNNLYALFTEMLYEAFPQAKDDETGIFVYAIIPQEILPSNCGVVYSASAKMGG